MAVKSYSKAFNIQIAKDALKPENERVVEILVVKYGIMPSCTGKDMRIRSPGWPES